MKILVIEDDKIINNNIKTIFNSSGFLVDQAFTGAQGLQKSQINYYEVIVLDINLPVFDGFEYLKQLRSLGNKTPVIVLSARDSIDDKTKAFKYGADDYLVKPFDLNILVMKINALISRLNNKGNVVFKAGNIKINTFYKTVTNIKSGKLIDLTAKEYSILECLIINNGRFVTAENILESVWGEQIDEFTQTVKIHISNIRKKIGDIIINKKGQGYKIQTKVI